MEIIVIENASDRCPDMAGRRFRLAAFVVLCSSMFGSALYAAKLVDRMQEIGSIEKSSVMALGVSHQIPMSIDSMFKR